MLKDSAPSLDLRLGNFWANGRPQINEETNASLCARLNVHWASRGGLTPTCAKRGKSQQPSAPSLRWGPIRREVAEDPAASHVVRAKCSSFQHQACERANGWKCTKIQNSMGTSSRLMHRPVYFHRQDRAQVQQQE